MKRAADTSCAAPRPLPLAGIKVLDLGNYYHGPYCGFLLSQAGADVVKIEPPAGDGARGLSRSGRGLGESLRYAFETLNAGKRLAVLDLRLPADRETLLQLVERADVLFENFTPGALERLELTKDTLFQRNPRLVYGQGTGFGTTGVGPAMGSAFDLTMQAHMGIVGVNGFPDSPPVKVGVAFVDFLAGVHLYAAVVTALLDVARTGKGRCVEISMAEATFPTLASNQESFYRSGVGQRTGNLYNSGTIVPCKIT